MKYFKIKSVCIIFLTTFFYLGCSSDLEIKIDEAKLKELKVSDFIFPTKEEPLFKIQENGRSFIINNVVSSEFTNDDYFYCFLSTDEEDKQTLLVINKKKDMYKWTCYYPETSHFYTKNLVAFVIKPFPERHTEREIIVTDFFNDLVFENKDSSKRSTLDDTLQDLYYLAPFFGQDEINSELNIFWEQAHYPMSRMRYLLQLKRVGFSSNDKDYSIIELLEDTNTVLNFPLDKLPDDFTVICSQTSGKYEIAIIVKPEGSLDWKDYYLFIFDSDTNTKKRISLASVFRYQDSLVEIRPAIPTDNRAAFIIETAEFSYDFYFDPITCETDSFLRPSSFTTRYPH